MEIWWGLQAAGKKGPEDELAEREGRPVSKRVCRTE
jgi:hypothetical protein